MLHRFSPFAIQFGDGYGIRWYGLAYLAGFVAGYLFMRRMARLGRTALSVEAVGDFVFAVAMGTIIGGRLGFCFLYDPSLFSALSPEFPYWGVLAIHRGGMASHGGMVGIIIACLWFGRKHAVSPLGLMDLTVVAAAIGIFFGRIANFINGELVGRPCSPGFPLAVQFPQDILLWPQYAPEKLGALGPVVETMNIAAEKWNSILSHPAAYTQVEGILYGVIHQIQNGNAATARALEPLLTPRHPSQLYEALLEGALLFFAGMWMWSRRDGLRTWRRPGVITAIILITYCIVRIIGEQFRMPDIFIGFQWLGLTRGQWLSIAALVASSAFGLWCFLRTNDLNPPIN